MFKWLSLFMGIAYMVLGILIITYKFFVVNLEPNVAYPLGALMFFYGIFRIFRAIKKIREKNDV